MSKNNQLTTYIFEDGISTITLDDGKANVMSVEMLYATSVVRVRSANTVPADTTWSLKTRP